MSRLSIELSDEEHRRLKVAASLQGRTIKDFVLERVFAKSQSDDDLQALDKLLEPRIAEAETGQYSTESVGDIFAEVKKDLNKPKSKPKKR